MCLIYLKRGSMRLVIFKLRLQTKPNYNLTNLKQFINMHAFLEHFKTTSDAVTYFPPAMSLPLYTHESPKKAYNCSNEANSIAGKKVLSA